MSKKIVWDLFGGLNGSVKKAIDNKELYEIYTFDILPETKDGEKNIVLDISDNFENIKAILDKYPKPDILTSSPVCIPFSRASAMKNGTAAFILDENGMVIDRPKEHYENKEINPNNYNYEKQVKNRTLGKIMIENTIKIIEEYKPKNWYIENPALSLIWNYIKNNLNWEREREREIGHYGAYGYISKKPTGFLSNQDLKLKKVDKGYRSYQGTKQTKWEDVKKKDRSDIPEGIIKDIFSQFTA